MELRCLTDDAALVRAVKNLNLVMSDDVLSGAAIADLEIERDGQRVVHLRTLAVGTQFRRQGIGRKLMMQIIQQAKELNREDGAKVTSVRLHVHEGNEDGLAFYKALGFAEEARLEDYYRHLEPRTALVMQYLL
ncbi:hypothetical protein BBJ29_004326 [Phytophthora kernoviae]|uniref:N-acetyltransferase domain-containing protein n=1 Tax=Phytophthora kernoviae TaxID=325452 RepID=A0A3F2RXH0_9STRA|nr:hypothetical protein BBJ29_004326 [Phytophthora kernoviae]RLN66126.1 hypothetical protein BBP00_00002402 [Phytophthora kernoviae]